MVLRDVLPIPHWPTKAFSEPESLDVSTGHHKTDGPYCVIFLFFLYCMGRESGKCNGQVERKRGKKMETFFHWIVFLLISGSMESYQIRVCSSCAVQCAPTTKQIISGTEPSGLGSPDYYLG
jgi:hypothetical protein